MVQGKTEGNVSLFPAFIFVDIWLLVSGILHLKRFTAECQDQYNMKAHTHQMPDLLLCAYIQSRFFFSIQKALFILRILLLHGVSQICLDYFTTVLRQTRQWMKCHKTGDGHVSSLKMGGGIQETINCLAFLGKSLQIL